MPKLLQQIFTDVILKSRGKGKIKEREKGMDKRKEEEKTKE
jgi:hypothetical protein